MSSCRLFPLITEYRATNWHFYQESQELNRSQQSLCLLGEAGCSRCKTPLVPHGGNCTLLLLVMRSAWSGLRHRLGVCRAKFQLCANFVQQ